MPITLRELIDELTSSYLLDAEQCALCLDRFGMTAESGDAEIFASRLVEHDEITQFQASAALQKRSTALVIGDYHVLDVIGSGGMGQVYKARHRIMKRLVAIKIMHTARATNPKLVQRFYREVEAAARLSHPNIVTAYDAGETPGGLYLAMEYVDGVDLSVILNTVGALGINQAVNIVLQVARGLAYAHSHNVIHRDVKPSNLLLDRDGTVKILDMGLARFTEDEAAEVSLTMVGPLMGTVEYMAPEHAANARHADHRSDIYSLGCTMYRLLTGHLPYGGETPVEKVIAQREHPIPLLSKKIGEIPENLQGIFARMVAKAPEDRYQTMDDCLTDLLKIAGDAEHCDISGLTNMNTATATTVFDEGPPDAETSIGDYIVPPVTLDAARSMQAPARESEASSTQAPTESGRSTLADMDELPRRRGAKLLLVEIAILVGILVGIGLRTFFAGDPPRRGGPGPGPRSRPVLGGQWYDLLKDVDVNADAIAEKWDKLPDGSVMACANGTEHSRMSAGGTLPPNYQVRMSFTRHEGDSGVGLILPLGRHNQVSLEIDGTVLTTDVRHVCLASVQCASGLAKIVIEVDGRELIKYDGAIADLRCVEGWEAPLGGLGFGVHKDVSARIHELSVRSFVGGKAASMPSTQP
ncbi:MAG: serine/threonine-protein kinase [Phycisphaerae bacterium]|jgi:serine/threonine protein kinase|nr:serine/threonine-protein kinase [Phycisphaerae bacterium]